MKTMKRIAIFKDGKKIELQVASTIREVNRIVEHCKNQGLTVYVYSKGV